MSHKQHDIYKPNSFNSGCAFSFKIVEKDKEGNNQKPSFLVQSIKQASWNSQKRTGSFSANAKDPEKNIYFKLGENEIGGMLNAIENYVEFSAYHSYNDDKTQISFKPYTKKNGQKAFSFSVVKNSTLKFGMGVEIAEARTLKGLFDLFLFKYFNY
jgi:predicted restriction endonuclease|tara:strand:+ start:1853 stop:2320 length:468 start_codon:yes stop_codon:yes gene_type:complete